MSKCLSVCLDHFQGNIVLAAMSVTADNLMRILRSSSVFLTPLTGEKLTAQRIWNSQFSILHRESAQNFITFFSSRLGALGAECPWKTTMKIITSNNSSAVLIIVLCRSTGLVKIEKILAQVIRPISISFKLFLYMVYVSIL